MVYFIIHYFNQAYGPCSFHEVLSAHATMHDAEKKLQSIKESIATGHSYYFPGEKPIPEPYGITNARGLTYPWTSEAGDQMFSHFYIDSLPIT